VLAVGGIEPRKGTLDLVTAVAAVRRQLPDVGLVVAGGATIFDYRRYAEEVHARAAALAVPLTMLGPIGHAALPALVASASVFGFPSTKEGFGLAAMEALAAGVPVVVRDLPVFREVFGSAVAFAAGPETMADELVSSIVAPDPVRRSAGRAVVGRHQWDDAAEAHLRLYRSMRPVVAG
jgi:glycosyltransferase involved in cell wall biosynthesis